MGINWELGVGSWELGIRKIIVSYLIRKPFGISSVRDEYRSVMVISRKKAARRAVCKIKTSRFRGGARACDSTTGWMIHFQKADSRNLAGRIKIYSHRVWSMDEAGLAGFVEGGGKKERKKRRLRQIHEWYDGEYGNMVIW